MTVKVPGKRPPRAVAPAGPSPVPHGSVPGVNGLSKELTAADSTSTGTFFFFFFKNVCMSHVTEARLYGKIKAGVIPHFS